MQQGLVSRERDKSQMRLLYSLFTTPSEINKSLGNHKVFDKPRPHTQYLHVVSQVDDNLLNNRSSSASILPKSTDQVSIELIVNFLIKIKSSSENSRKGFIEDFLKQLAKNNQLIKFVTLYDSTMQTSNKFHKVLLKEMIFANYLKPFWRKQAQILIGGSELQNVLVDKLYSSHPFELILTQYLLNEISELFKTPRKNFETDLILAIATLQTSPISDTAKNLIRLRLLKNIISSNQFHKLAETVYQCNVNKKQDYLKLLLSFLMHPSLDSYWKDLLKADKKCNHAFSGTVPLKLPLVTDEIIKELSYQPEARHPFLILAGHYYFTQVPKGLEKFLYYLNAALDNSDLGKALTATGFLNKALSFHSDKRLNTLIKIIQKMAPHDYMNSKEPSLRHCCTIIKDIYKKQAQLNEVILLKGEYFGDYSSIKILFSIDQDKLLTARIKHELLSEQFIAKIISRAELATKYHPLSGQLLLASTYHYLGKYYLGLYYLYRKRNQYGNRKNMGLRFINNSTAISEPWINQRKGIQCLEKASELINRVDELYKKADYQPFIHNAHLGISISEFNVFGAYNLNNYRPKVEDDYNKYCHLASRVSTQESKIDKSLKSPMSIGIGS